MTEWYIKVHRGFESYLARTLCACQPVGQLERKLVTCITKLRFKLLAYGLVKHPSRARSAKDPSLVHTEIRRSIQSGHRQGVIQHPQSKPMSTIRLAIFWIFQVSNGLTSLSMVTSPATFHEAMLPKPPQQTYKLLGFSPTAVEMVHNTIRGHGSALLAITLYLAAQGSADPLSYLLIGLTCVLSFVSHVCTAVHHIRSPAVMAAIGSIRPLYGILALNSIVGIPAFVTYWYA